MKIYTNNEINILSQWSDKIWTPIPLENKFGIASANKNQGL